MIKSRRMRWWGCVERMGENTKAYKILGRNPEGKRPLRRPRNTWKDNIKMDLRKRVLEVWIEFIRQRVGIDVDFCENRNEPSSFIKGGQFLNKLAVLFGFSRRR
jgi:hypothetical protein